MRKYNIFKRKVSFEEYLKTWNPEDLEKASEQDKLDAYYKYKFKVEVFNRDNFMCQNKGKSKTECPYCGNIQYHPKLTAHHVKHQRNIKEKYEGDILRKKLYSVRNGVTICEASHKAFNRYKDVLSFVGEHLPNHINNHIFKLYKPQKISMKELAVKGREIKKQNKDKRYILTTKDIPLVLLLFRLLYVPYYRLGGDYNN